MHTLVHTHTHKYTHIGTHTRTHTPKLNESPKDLRQLRLHLKCLTRSGIRESLAESENCQSSRECVYVCVSVCVSVCFSVSMCVCLFRYFPMVLLAVSSASFCCCSLFSFALCFSSHLHCFFALNFARLMLALLLVCVCV